MKEMTLACGVTLQLQAVQETILQDLMLEFGDMALIRQPERILQLKGAQQVRALAATGKLFTYCAGWGVVNDPPAEANELMELLGRDTAGDKPHLRRADWIRTIAQQQERGGLIGQVMAITFEKRETVPSAGSGQAVIDTAVGEQPLSRELIDKQTEYILQLEAELKALQKNGRAAPSAEPESGG